MKNLAVIFPGLDYSVDKPLLYYAGKIVKNFGFDVVKINYGKFPEGERQKMVDYAIMAANVAVNKIAFEMYDAILFISKGNGTIVAGGIQQNLSRKVYNIFFAPVNESIPLFMEDCLVFTSSNDDKINISEVMKRRGEITFELQVSKEADHALELGDIQRDISMLRKIEEICQRYIEKRFTIENQGAEDESSHS